MQHLLHRKQEQEKRIKQGLTTSTGRYSTSDAEPHRIPESIPDPANRFLAGIVLGVCVICSGWVVRWEGRYVDLDEEAAAADDDL
jgi:hypothetical protein